MKNTPSPPPRSLPLQTRLIVQFSHIYSLGGWISTGIGSGVLWLIYTLSHSSYSDSLENEFLGILVAGLFLLLGLFSLRLSISQGRRIVKLLIKGETTYGKLLKSKDELSSMMENISKVGFIDDMMKKKVENTGGEQMEFDDYLEKAMDDRKSLEPQNVIMDYSFEYTTKTGSTHTISHKVKYIDGGELEDEPQELVLYDPAHPDKAFVYDAIKNAPRIDGHGNFQSLASSKLVVLIAPSLVILMNLFFIFINFPHWFGI